jgi:Txe/YoeB family toxin of Txe-Axe toxin-antitoxin module
MPLYHSCGTMMHRLVYGATEDELIIIQARYHYDD